MNKMSTAELREKEVINLCGGERLGYPCDFEFDLDDGHITAIIVVENNGALWAYKREEYIIPWRRIECIGEDAILIKIPQNELITGNCSCKSSREGKKRKR